MKLCLLNENEVKICAKLVSICTLDLVKQIACMQPKSWIDGYGSVIVSTYYLCKLVHWEGGNIVAYSMPL